MSHAGRIHHPGHHMAPHSSTRANQASSGFARILAKHEAQACEGSLQPQSRLGAFIGRSTGSGQCVALVRAAHPALGPTASWQRGAPVQGNLSIPPGTPIATFARSGHYANATDGSSHAAIYLGQSEDGLQVLDQWSGRPAAIRTIPWNKAGAVAANTGCAFHIVKSAVSENT